MRVRGSWVVLEGSRGEPGVTNGWAVTLVGLESGEKIAVKAFLGAREPVMMDLAFAAFSSTLLDR